MIGPGPIPASKLIGGWLVGGLSNDELWCLLFAKKWPREVLINGICLWRILNSVNSRITIPVSGAAAIIINAADEKDLRC